MKVTDELSIAVAEPEPLQLQALENTFSLLLVTDRFWLPTALEVVEPPLHHQDQPLEEFELKVVVDIGARKTEIAG